MVPFRASHPPGDTFQHGDVKHVELHDQPVFSATTDLLVSPANYFSQLKHRLQVFLNRKMTAAPAGDSGADEPGIGLQGCAVWQPGRGASSPYTISRDDLKELPQLT
jgi:hypothetical protein